VKLTLIKNRSQTELRQMAEKFSNRMKEMRLEIVRLRQERDAAYQKLDGSILNRYEKIIIRLVNP
jgi:predicted  nucleic acid-binding Zn-ribbon protein